MDYLEKYRYSKDNPEDFDIKLKDTKRPEILDESHLSNLLSHSIKITNDIMPKVHNCIEGVLKD